MLTFYLAAALLVVLACTGAPLRRLATVRVRHAWLLWAALIDQILVISVLPNTHPTLLAGAHLASYVAAGACLLLNRRLPGAWLVAAGGILNAAAIIANQGIMPASAAALRASGRQGGMEHFTNSDVLAQPRLAFLGDILATPAWLPGATVFSIGDIVIWIGIGWFLWRSCRPQPGETSTPAEAERPAGSSSSPLGPSHNRASRET
jgi:hypothetical protein